MKSVTSVVLFVTILSLAIAISVLTEKAIRPSDGPR
jgi:hypothetical protein